MPAARIADLALMDLEANIESLFAVANRDDISDPTTIVPAKIPWDEPAFSARMLAEHLDQSHDAASRNLETIDAHVRWIFEELLRGRPADVLDLGCGPGLYTERLAERGCTCLGIDFSPASIAYARARADERGLACTYRQADITTTHFGSGHDLAMLIFGELNAFTREQAADILHRAAAALGPGGTLLLEPHSRTAVVAFGQEPRSWYTSEAGLFSPDPHLVLTERAWIDATATTRVRHFVVDASTARVEVFGEELYAYGDDQYRSLLEAAGFTDIEIFPGFGDEIGPHTIVITARTG